MFQVVQVGGKKSGHQEAAETEMGERQRVEDSETTLMTRIPVEDHLRTISEMKILTPGSDRKSSLLLQLPVRRFRMFPDLRNQSPHPCRPMPANRQHLQHPESKSRLISAPRLPSQPSHPHSNKSSNNLPQIRTRITIRLSLIYSRPTTMSRRRLHLIQRSSRPT